jgi:hypothetical protein
MKFVTIRTNASGRRHEALGGRDYLVVPAVLITEMVLNNELALASEFGAFPEAWDGRPVTLGHPKKGGHHISANSPAVLEEVGVGYLFNTHLDGTKLRSELWIDTAKAKALGGKAALALNMLERGEPLEVSTGYFSQVLPGEGIFNGVAYSGQQLGIRPDHLALLPGELGACSWAAGCGAGRFNSRKDSGMNEKLKKFLQTNRLKAMELAGVVPALDLRANDVSQNEAWTAINEALGETLGLSSYSYWIEDIYDDAVVYRQYESDYSAESNLYRRTYTISDDNLEVTLGEAEEVVKRVSYDLKANEGEPSAPDEPAAEPEATDPPAPTDASDNPVEEEPETDPPVETSEPEVVLDDAPVPTANAKPCGCGEQKGQTVNEKPKANTEKPQTMEDYIAGIPDAGVRSFIANGVKKQAERRSELIEGLKANARNTFGEDDLQAMSDEHLERLTEMLASEDYSGRGVPRANRSESAVEEPLLLSSVPQQEAPKN